MKKKFIGLLGVLLLLICILFFFFPAFFSSATSYKKDQVVADQAINTIQSEKSTLPVIPPLDVVAYNQKLLQIANNPPDPIVYSTTKTVEKNNKGKLITKITKVPLSPQPVKNHLWPVKTVYPNAGALLPFNRIIAYYGNLYSKNMGVLGEYPED